VAASWPPNKGPLGGHWQIFAALPIDLVEPTPYRRDLSQPHLEQLSVAGGDLFFRFQLGLALAALPETRAEGIRWLRYGFDMMPLYLPLTQQALGRTYEAARQRDSAGMAYGRFLRLWDKADPELQGRVREAKEALQAENRVRGRAPPTGPR